MSTRRIGADILGCNIVMWSKSQLNGNCMIDGSELAASAQCGSIATCRRDFAFDLERAAILYLHQHHRIRYVTNIHIL